MQPAGTYFFYGIQLNSYFKTAVRLPKNGKDHLVRERESFDDLLQNQIVVIFNINFLKLLLRLLLRFH